MECAAAHTRSFVWNIVFHFIYFSLFSYPIVLFMRSKFPTLHIAEDYVKFFFLAAMCMVRDICKFPLEHYKTIFKRLFYTRVPPSHNLLALGLLPPPQTHTIKTLLSEKGALYPLVK